MAESTTDMADDGLVWIHVTESSSLEGMVFEDRKYEGTRTDGTADGIHE